MTVICSGGTSSARPQYAASLFMGPSAIAALLNNIPTVWAVPLAAYIGKVTYDLTTFCTVDPPAVPTFTAADVIGLLNVYNPVVNVPAAEKFQQLIGAYLWYQVCQCDSVATPAAPAAPAAPTGMPAINPTLPGVPPAAAPCLTIDSGVQTVTAGASPMIVAGPFATPPGLTGYVITAYNQSGGVAGQCEYEFRHSTTPGLGGASAGGGCQGGVGLQTNSSGLFSFGLQRQYCYLTMKVTSGTLVGRMVMDFYCGGAFPGGPVTPCGCPPDPLLQGQVDRILDLVTLMQRHMVPFNTADGASHGPFTGEGGFDVEGLVGVRVELTVSGSQVGVRDNNPDLLFDAGWIAIATEGGLLERRRIDSDLFEWLPRRMSDATSVAFFLGPGVSATLTELERAP